MVKNSVKTLIAACHPETANIGFEILKEHGSAIDAFIAATVLDCVRGPGVTSLAGSLGALIYSSNERKLKYLHAGLKRPFSSKSLSTNPLGLNSNSQKTPGIMENYYRSYKK